MGQGVCPREIKTIALETVRCCLIISFISLLVQSNGGLSCESLKKIDKCVLFT